MNTITKVFLSYCRSNVYLIFGMCFGLCISSFFTPTNDGDCLEMVEDLAPPLSVPKFSDIYEPKMNLEGKPLRAKKTPKVFMRPRYYSTELGIREKLFVGVLTSREYLYSRGVAQNKTIAHLVDKIRYFISITEGAKPNVSLPGIVGFTDTRSILKPFHVLKYITDNYLEDYDYYYLIKDLTYVDVRKMTKLVNKISISQDVHLGIASKFGTYCSLDSGILLSNSVIRKMKNNLDWCVRNTYSDSDDVNFGRCIVHSSSLPCSDAIQGQTIKSTVLNESFALETNLYASIAQNYSESPISVYPVFDHSTIYKLNAYIARLELTAVTDQISTLRQEILKTAKLEPEKDHSVTWPIGNQPGNKPPGRFDIVKWTYFNETHMASDKSLKNMQKFEGSVKADIEYVIKAATDRIEGNYKGMLEYKKFLNGYKRYDASRGMDYILDLVFAETKTKEELVKRVEICKPLGKVEILTVPYVTENARVHLILTVNKFQKNETIKFMAHYAQTCMEKKDKTFLMVVLLYDVNSPSKDKDDVFFDVKQHALSLTEKYKKDQSKVTWLSIRLPSSVSSIELEPMLKIAVTDLVVRKFSPESLILFVETEMELKVDYLNRVRMNTISQWQVFSPMPFVEYHPDIAYSESKAKENELDINRNYGRYDEYNFNHVAFYAKDYTSIRKLAESIIPTVRADRDIATVLKPSKQNLINSAFELFILFGDLHPFRALEPALKIRYKEMNCRGTQSDVTHIDCMKARSLNLGNRGQLAKLVLQYQHSN
ncbi:chondroitin sulfate synthase 2 [Neodiprion virginianus]|uniref:chondroitin sulfate synthase 2 n=1 Tax=Neodiprion virginianus TaxID=2961670 RepID=UPI001EE74A05|nr:chondroitin sulfate synthase 2 [Neodiprion virginianus]